MSTPIETNTEELQGVLDRMYNLPNLGGSGKVSWDCVISVSGTNLDFDELEFTVVSGSLRSVFDKLSRGEKPNVILRHFMTYDGEFGNWFCECLTMKHYETDYDDRQNLSMYFFFSDWLIRVYSNSMADIDSNTLNFSKNYLLYD